MQELELGGKEGGTKRMEKVKLKNKTAREREARREKWRSGRQGVGGSREGQRKEKGRQAGRRKEPRKREWGMRKEREEEGRTVKGWREAWGERRQERGDRRGNCCQFLAMNPPILIFKM